MTEQTPQILSLEELTDLVISLRKRLADLETQLASMDGKRPGRTPTRRRKEPRASESWSDAKLADADVIRPHIAKVMSGVTGRFTASEVAQLARIDGNKATLNTIGIVLRGWGLEKGKSNSRHPWEFDGRELV